MRISVIIILILFYLTAYSQAELYLGTQFEAGIVGKTAFENSSLKKRAISPHFGGQLFVNLRLLDVLAFELGFGQNFDQSRFKNPSFEEANEGFDLRVNSRNYFWNYYVSLSGFYKLGETKNYIYGKLSYSFNNYGGETINDNQTFEISSLNVNQNISTTISYVTTNQSIMPEIGLQRKFTNRNIISMGLKLNLGNSNAYTGTYQVNDNITKQSSVERFESLGNYTALTFRYNYLLAYLPKKERVKRIVKKEEREKEKPKKKDSLIETPKEIEDRKLVVNQKVKVHTSSVQVMIWDHQTVDGDRISLNFNGEWILENYTLKKEKHVITLELKEGLNVFVMHALNLGKYEPNTAALIVKEGIKSHKIILESDLNESGTLEINYKKKD